MKRKGIILAGGTGSRLYPLTRSACKQLLPVYDKPMIYYPLSVLMLSGIQDILVITTSHDMPAMQRLLKDGSQWGLNISFATQEEPNGIAEAFLIGEQFLGNHPSALVLGDNIFYGYGLSDLIYKVSHDSSIGATVFATHVKNPEAYGVVEFDRITGRAISVVEKPTQPKSRFAITGLYYYDNKIVEIAKSILPSARGELEITDVNNVYLNRGELNVTVLGRGTAWLDCGTHESLLQASNYIEAIESRQGLKVACPEEIAYRMDYITIDELARLGDALKKSSYGTYLLDLVNELKEQIVIQ